MRLRPFALAEPESVAEAIEVLTRLDGESRVIAGGTALVPAMRLGLLRPDRLVSLHRIDGLGAIRVEHGALEIGATATIAALAGHGGVKSGWSLLAQAAGSVATPAIRGSATLGGNLCHAEAASDPAPSLLCLEAQARVAGAAGERTVPIGEFFTGFYETVVGPGEILTGVRVPPMPDNARSGYVKFCPRSAEDRPLVGVAALVTRDDAQRVSEVRIALSAAAPTPIRARRAEATLSGEVLTEAAIRAAADAAAEEADPLSDLMGSADYRREMIQVWVRRLLLSLRG